MSGITPKEIARDTEYTEEEVREALEELADEGYAEQHTDGTWEVTSLRKALAFLWENRGVDSSPFPAIGVKTDG